MLVGGVVGLRCAQPNLRVVQGLIFWFWFCGLARMDGVKADALQGGEVGAGWWVCWASLGSAQPTGGAGVCFFGFGFVGWGGWMA